MKESPLADLSFFKFPDLSGNTVQNIVLLIFLLVLTVVGTVLIQRWAQNRNTRNSERAQFRRITGSRFGEGKVERLLERMISHSALGDSMDLVRDAAAYESAVVHLVAEGQAEDLEILAHLRKTFHINVMNPNMEIVSTRQLLRDVPVRVVIKTGQDKVDAYCTVIKIDELFLTLSLPAERDVEALLRSQPRAQLVYWREGEGESVFEIEVEPVTSEDMVLFRAAHVLRAEGFSHRKDFRISVDAPVHFTFITHDQLGQHKAGRDIGGAQAGEGHLVDISYGGASFVCAKQLEMRGLVQLKFPLRDTEARVVVEVAGADAIDGGQFQIRGYFRGLSGDMRAQLNHFIYREQTRRQQKNEVIHLAADA